jgi:hypothetical protein
VTTSAPDDKPTPERRHPSAISDHMAMVESSRKSFNLTSTATQGLKDSDCGHAATAHPLAGVFVSMPVGRRFGTPDVDRSASCADLLTVAGGQSQQS